MSWEDDPTQRIYKTDLGPVDWSRAASCANGIVCGNRDPQNFAVLAALFHVALRMGRAVSADGGRMFNGLVAAQLLGRLRTGSEIDDINALWSLLFALFEESRR